MQTKMQELLDKTATLAWSGKKMSKNAAFYYLEGLIKDGSLAPELAAALYSHFMPAIPAAPKTAKDWVLKAMPKNDVRYYLNNLRILELEGKLTLVATDGHRVHVTKAPELYQAGAYDAQMNSIDADVAGKYPNIMQVIPCHVAREMDSFEVDNLKDWVAGLDISAVKGVKAGVIDMLDYKVHVDLKYLVDASSLGGSATVYCSDPYSAIKIVQDSTIAVIMPLRV